jgi:hypothetical protein
MLILTILVVNKIYKICGILSTKRMIKIESELMAAMLKTKVSHLSLFFPLEKS